MITAYVEQENHHTGQMKAYIKARIEGFPGNEKINWVQPNVFIMNASELNKHDNWTPEFHDFQSQYRLILDRLDAAQSISTFKNFLVRVVRDKQFKIGKLTHKIHPDVIVKLQSLL